MEGDLLSETVASYVVRGISVPMLKFLSRILSFFKNADDYDTPGFLLEFYAMSLYQWSTKRIWNLYTVSTDRFCDILCSDQ